VLLALVTGGAYAVPLDYWTFDTDAVSNELNQTVNSGTLGSAWNFGGPTNWLTDGAGNFVVSNHSGQTYRKLNPYGSPLTNGIYTLELKLDSWDLDSVTTGGTLTFSALSTQADANTIIAGIRVNVLDADTARMQMFGNFGGTPSSGFRNVDLSIADAGGIDLAIEFDLDANTATYYTNGVVLDSLIDFTGSQIEALQFNTSGLWTTNSTVSINEMGLSDDSSVVIDPWEKMEYFAFEDAAGLSFGANWANSGTLNSRWNFGGPGTIATDGAGSLVITNHDGQTFRKLPGAGTANADLTADQYATPFTNGKYRLELDLNSWSLDGTAVNSTMNLQLRPTQGSGSVAGINLKVQDAATARVQLFYDGVDAGNQNNFRNFDFPLTNATAQSFMIEIDYDTATVQYYTNGVPYTTDYQAFAGTQLGTLQFSCNGSWDLDHVVSIAQMGVYRFNTEAAPVTAVDFASGQITNNIQIEYFDVPLDLVTPAAELPDHTGQPIYAGLELDPVNGKTTGDDGGSYTNGASISFGSNGGAKLQWNGPFSNPPVIGADLGRYEEDDVATGIFLVKQEDFLNGLDTGKVFMDATNDTLKATVRLDTKENDNLFPLKRLKSGRFRWVVQDDGSFYISAEVTNLTSDTGSVELTDEALEVSWFNYDPTTSITNILGAASPALQDIEALGFWMSATVLTNDGIRRYPNMQCSSFEVSATKPDATTPTELYAEWIAGYPGVGLDDGLLDDAEPDGLDNLFEYAIDSDPTSTVNVNTPVQSQVSDGGTNYMEYIYFERDDAASRGLAYILTVATDLVIGDWSDGSVYEIGSGAAAVPDFIAITNRIPIDAEDNQFFRLQVELAP
jgi:hypothetical protein